MLIRRVEDRYNPVIKMFEVEGEQSIVISPKVGGTPHQFNALSRPCHFGGLCSAHEHVEHNVDSVIDVLPYLNPEFRHRWSQRSLVVYSIVRV